MAAKSKPDRYARLEAKIASDDGTHADFLRWLYTVITTGKDPDKQQTTPERNAA